MAREYRLDSKLDARINPRIESEYKETTPSLRSEMKPDATARKTTLSTKTTRADASMADLFQSTLAELHQEAPIELLRSLRKRLEGMRVYNPNSARTAEACLLALASDSCPLLHVLTAAYLVNGGVMLKQQGPDETE